MKPPEQKPRSAKMNLTPMIDVVFLLIIFFVVTHTMMQNDVSMPIDLPAAETGTDDAESGSGRVIVNIDAAGNLFFGATEVTHDQLAATLLKEKSLARRPLEIRIRTDRNVPYAQIEPILVLCARQGIPDVSFSVVSE